MIAHQISGMKNSAPLEDKLSLKFSWGQTVLSKMARRSQAALMLPKKVSLSELNCFFRFFKKRTNKREINGKNSKEDVVRNKFYRQFLSWLG